jgi:hypothetical protein
MVNGQWSTVSFQLLAVVLSRATLVTGKTLDCLSRLTTDS